MYCYLYSVYTFSRCYFQVKDSIKFHNENANNFNKKPIS